MGPSEEEFREFVLGRSGPLLRTALLLTGDRGLAEDVLQATLIKTFLAWPRIRRADSVEAYARKVLLREVLSWRRRRRVAEVPVEMASMLAQRDESEQIAVRATLHAALQMLSARQRAVVVLRYFDDLPDGEIAHLLGISIGAVKSHAARALVHLRTTVGTTSAALTEDLP